MVNTLYKRDNDDRVAVTNILVVNLSENSFISYTGSRGIRVIPMEIDKSSDCIMIAWLRNGDIAYLNTEEFDKIEIDEERNAFIQFSKIINKKIATVQMIRNQVNF